MIIPNIPSEHLYRIMAPHAEPYTPSFTTLKSEADVDRVKTPLETIDATLAFKTPNHIFWWARTGPQLATLLHHAGYTPSDQYTELLFYALHIIPSLGPAPAIDGTLQWKSPQTPDGTPLDLSWEWGLDGKGVIRTSFEPIGPLAGTAADPSNSYETDRWIRHLESQGLVKGLDLEWYGYFASSVLPDAAEAQIQRTNKLDFELAPDAGTFVTRDVDLTKGPIVKMYMFPGLRAQQVGGRTSNLDVVERAIRGLPKEQFDALAPDPLLDFLDEATQKWNMEVGIFSFDLLKPESSRIKLYTRAPHTSIEYLMDALTLGGRQSISMYSEEAFADLKDFWKIFIGEAPAVLPSGGKERAGPGFYFTIKAGKPATPKVYISPASFCESDAEVLKRLWRFFETRRKPGKMLEQMEKYEKALEEMYGSQFLRDQCDVHFYIGCALEVDQLRVVTYMCPQILSREDLGRNGQSK
ncbi:unnamed protein product [Periconia digitata]|uniref:Aromatic prenyltransferase n=1 Tax=Periconia digitata TaxID=1303443 RepID=A0A9W4UE69_9PLEO|nr:unnamed protein product [Periconia digitata]